MAIEIPHDVALFLNYIGVPYPDINEDQVRALGTMCGISRMGWRIRRYPRPV